MADDSNARFPWEIPSGNNQDISGSAVPLSQVIAAQPVTTIPVKKVKKKSKKEKKSASYAEPDVIPEPEEPPPEGPDSQCKTPPPAPEEEEPIVDKLHTPVEDGVGTSLPSSQTNDAPSPIYLTFNAQHRLLVFLQQKLEEMCFAFCQQHMPQTLLDYGWDCPESAELQNWVAASSSIRPRVRNELMTSMIKIRDCAVNRIHIDHIQLEKLLADALKLARCLEEDQYVKTIQRLQEDTANTHLYLEDETKQIQKSFNFKLDQIAAARAKLDDFEKATKTALDKSLLTRQNKARAMILQSIQNVEALEQRLEPEDRSVTMSSLDLVNDLENSLMLEEDGGRLF